MARGCVSGGGLVATGCESEVGWVAVGCECGAGAEGFERWAVGVVRCEWHGILPLFCVPNFTLTMGECKGKSLGFFNGGR